MLYCNCKKLFLHRSPSEIIILFHWQHFKIQMVRVMAQMFWGTKSSAYWSCFREKCVPLTHALCSLVLSLELAVCDSHAGSHVGSCCQRAGSLCRVKTSLFQKKQSAAVQSSPALPAGSLILESPARLLHWKPTHCHPSQDSLKWQKIRIVMCDMINCTLINIIQMTNASLCIFIFRIIAYLGLLHLIKKMQ